MITINESKWHMLLHLNLKEISQVDISPIFHPSIEIRYVLTRLRAYFYQQSEYTKQQRNRN